MNNPDLIKSNNPDFFLVKHRGYFEEKYLETLGNSESDRLYYKDLCSKQAEELKKLKENHRKEIIEIIAEYNLNLSLVISALKETEVKLAKEEASHQATKDILGKICRQIIVSSGYNNIPPSILKVIKIVLGSVLNTAKEVNGLSDSNDSDSAPKTTPNSENVKTDTSERKETQPKSTPEKKKVGGQMDHEFHQSSLSKKVPNEIVEKKCKKPPTGSKPIFDENGTILYYEAQIKGLNWESIITSYRFYVSDDAPPNDSLMNELSDKFRINNVVYDDSINAFVVLLATRCAVATNKIVEIINVLSNGEINLSEGTIVNMETRFASICESAYLSFFDELLKCEILFTDETGITIDGKSGYMHVLASKNYVAYEPSKTRSASNTHIDASRDEFLNVLLSDHFSHYGQHKKCIHSECMRHYTNYLTTHSEVDGLKEAEQMLNLFFYAKDWVERGLSLLEREAIRDEILSLAQKVKYDYDSQLGLLNKIKDEKKPKWYPTIDRLLKKPDDYFRWLFDSDIPFDNNYAERLLRLTKTKFKVSGQVKNISMAYVYAINLSIIETGRAQGKRPIDVILDYLKS
jgi:hypothetical protein